MARTVNIHGGGAQTNVNGLGFEQTTSLDDALRNAGFSVVNCVVFKDGQRVGMSVQKYNLYSKFLVPNGINYKEYNSKKWLPDECFINEVRNTAFIIEKKFQNSPGSVDEKLPGCDFKKKEYEKLFRPLGYNVEYLYVFNTWFHDPRYQDTLEYIKGTGCHYYFEEIPLEFLGLS